MIIKVVTDMTFDKAKALLEENNVSFSELYFDSVAEFRLHISPFAYTKNAGAYPVKVLVISSNNNHKNIELQFIDEIKSIISNDVIVICANDLIKEKWISDQIFDKKETDGFGLPGFERAMQRINKKKGLVANLFGSKTQYEIYDWNSYQCIIK